MASQCATGIGGDRETTGRFPARCSSSVAQVRQRSGESKRNQRESKRNQRVDMSAYSNALGSSPATGDGFFPVKPIALFSPKLSIRLILSRSSSATARQLASAAASAARAAGKLSIFLSSEMPSVLSVLLRSEAKDDVQSRRSTGQSLLT